MMHGVAVLAAAHVTDDGVALAGLARVLGGASRLTRVDAEDGCGGRG